MYNKTEHGKLVCLGKKTHSTLISPWSTTDILDFYQHLKLSTLQRQVCSNRPNWH